MVKRLPAPGGEKQLKQRAPFKNTSFIIFRSHRDMTTFSEGGCHKLELEELSGTVCTYRAKW